MGKHGLAEKILNWENEISRRKFVNSVDTFTLNNTFIQFLLNTANDNGVSIRKHPPSNLESRFLGHRDRVLLPLALERLALCSLLIERFVMTRCDEKNQNIA